MKYDGGVTGLYLSAMFHVSVVSDLNGKKKKIWKSTHFSLIHLPALLYTKPELPVGHMFALTELEL